MKTGLYFSISSTETWPLALLKTTNSVMSRYKLHPISEKSDGKKRGKGKKKKKKKKKNSRFFRHTKLWQQNRVRQSILRTVRPQMPENPHVFPHCEKRFFCVVFLPSESASPRHPNSAGICFSYTKTDCKVACWSFPCSTLTSCMVVVVGFKVWVMRLYLCVFVCICVGSCRFHAVLNQEKGW